MRSALVRRIQPAVTNLFSSDILLAWHFRLAVNRVVYGIYSFFKGTAWALSKKWMPFPIDMANENSKASFWDLGECKHSPAPPMSELIFGFGLSVIQVVYGILHFSKASVSASQKNAMPNTTCQGRTEGFPRSQQTSDWNESVCCSVGIKIAPQNTDLRC